MIRYWHRQVKPISENYPPAIIGFFGEYLESFPGIEKLAIPQQDRRATEPIARQPAQYTVLVSEYSFSRSTSQFSRIMSCSFSQSVWLSPIIPVTWASFNLLSLK
jgi:hypothetical protein